jgi:hypothetical protein
VASEKVITNIPIASFRRIPNGSEPLFFFLFLAFLFGGILPNYGSSAVFQQATVGGLTIAGFQSLLTDPLNTKGQPGYSRLEREVYSVLHRGYPAI